MLMGSMAHGKREQPEKESSKSDKKSRKCDLKKKGGKKKKVSFKKRGLKEKNMVEIIGFVSVSKRKGIVCSLQT